jgi:hypothetical protein
MRGARPAWDHARVIAAIRLSVLASELENRAGTQQHYRYDGRNSLCAVRRTQ